MSKFYTQANNFTSAVNGGVDPRTGLYNVNLKLGTIIGNDNLGPQLPISLSYSAMSVFTAENYGNYGLGNGVSLGISSYDTQTRQLSLSTGEQYTAADTLQAQEDYQPVTLVDNPLNVTQLERNKYNYRVTHKSGDREILTNEAICVPEKLVTATGHALNLEWQYTNDPTPVPLLTGVYDTVDKDTGSKNYLLTVAYENTDYIKQNGWVTLTFFPKSSTESYEVDLDFDESGNIATVTNKALSLTDKTKWLTWSFTYESADGWPGYSVLTGFTAPGGLKESVTYAYDENGTQFPLVNGQPANPGLPKATSFTQDPGGGQPEVSVAYTYSDTNYLGYPNTPSWQDNADNIYSIPQEYTYQSTETRTAQTISGDTVTVTTERTYNNFHLQTQEKVEQGDCTHTTDTEYYAEVGVPLGQQAKYFQFPKSSTVTWQTGDQKRSIVTQMEYDDWGNQTKKTDPDGTVTAWTYYPANAEYVDGTNPNNKVPDPWAQYTNGQRFMQEMTVTPPTDGVYSKYTSDTRPYKKTYEYQAYVGSADPDALGAILKSKQTHYTVYDPMDPSKDVKLAERAYEYVTDTEQYGMLSQRTGTHWSSDSPSSPYTTTEAFGMAPDPNNDQALIHTKNLTTHDKLTLALSSQKSRSTGRTWKHTDSKGNVTSYEYDGLGRRTKKTLNSEDADPTYNSSTQYGYDLNVKNAEGVDCPLCVTTTDVKGNKTQKGYDGLGRSISVDINNVDASSDDDTWYPQGSKQYDMLGRVLTSTSKDQFLTQKQNLSQSLSLSYDGWGYVQVTETSDGVLQVTETDPILLTQTVSLQSKARIPGTQEPQLQTGSTKTTYDIKKRTIRVDRYEVGKTDPYSTHTWEYDGLGRLRSETDELGHTTTYDYDDWKRVVKTTLSDGTIIGRTYSGDSPAKLVIEIQVTSGDVTVSAGTRAFDGLGRVTNSTIGGSVTQYTYQDASDRQPTTVTTADGITKTYAYIKELGNALSSVTTTGAAQNITQTFDYDHATGILTSATEGEMICTYTSYTSGLPKTETLNFDGGEDRTMSYAYYSVGGALSQYNHVDGATYQLTYEDSGQLASASDTSLAIPPAPQPPPTTMTPTYDLLQRATSWVTADPSGDGHTLGNTLVLDDFSRETSRTITDSKGTSWTITQSFYVNDQLNQRTTKRTTPDGKTTTLRDETYVYDERNRLQKWTCTGDDPTGFPTDPYGNAMTEQDFVMDALGNITQVTTTCVNGSNVATFTYDDPAHDPFRLINVANTNTALGYPSSVTPVYDANTGVMTDDGSLRTFTYDALGRVATLTNKVTSQSLTYGYDAHNRLCKQAQP